jgi:hypothetical protein
MIINMNESRVKDAAKRMRKILRGFGLKFSHMECLEITVRLLDSRTGSATATVGPRRLTRSMKTCLMRSSWPATSFR